MLKIIGWVSLFSSSLYALMCGYLFIMQRSILYYPTPPARSSAPPSFTFTHEGQTLEVFKIDRNTSRALIYFGGNAEDVSLSTASLGALFPGHTIYLPCYRGYGNSSGTPSEQALIADALFLYDLVAKEFRDITLLGRSLGSGIAIQLAAQRPVNRIILTTPYDSMVRVAQHYYPFFPVKLLLRDRFDSLEKAGRIGVPALLLIAEHDEVIPRQNSERLLAALTPQTTQFEIIRGTDHNTIDLSPSYQKAIRTFLRTFSK